MGLEYKFTPKQCEGKDAKFEGSVTLKGLHFEKKMEMLEDLDKNGFSLSDLTNMQEKAKQDPMSAIKLMKEFVVKTKDLWVECDIKEKSTGIELKSYDEVASYPKAHSILFNVAMHITGGGLGN